MKIPYEHVAVRHSKYVFLSYPMPQNRRKAIELKDLRRRIKSMPSRNISLALNLVKFMVASADRYERKI